MDSLPYLSFRQNFKAVDLFPGIGFLTYRARNANIRNEAAADKILSGAFKAYHAASAFAMYISLVAIKYQVQTGNLENILK